MKRKMIEINEALCDGCGDCVTECAEGALQIVDGKAKVVREDFCDGFGDCVGTCPTGALTVVEREAPAFNEQAVKHHLRTTQGESAVERMETAQKLHHARASHSMAHSGGGCPGSRVQTFERKPSVPTTTAGPAQAIPSELNQWPIQLHLVPPTAPFFNHRELVVLSTCGPIASADIHWRFLRGRSVVVACPKLDQTGPYAQKLGVILSNPTIPKVHVVIMEVPCCGGLTRLLEEGIALSGRQDLETEEHILSIDGKLLAQRKIQTATLPSFAS